MATATATLGKMYIDGKWCESASGQTRAPGEQLGAVGLLLPLRDRLDVLTVVETDRRRVDRLLVLLARGPANPTPARSHEKVAVIGVAARSDRCGSPRFG